MNTTATSQKTNLVFIVAAGHSGSTLLNKILGAQQNVIGVGELMYLNRSIHRGKVCPCEKTYDQCEMWSKVIEQSPVSIKDLKPTELRKISKKLQFLNPYRPTEGLWDQDYLERFGQKHEALYQTIARVSGNGVIIDSSKAYRLAFVLHQSGIFNMKIIFLNRDSASYLGSKKRRSDERFNFLGLLILYIKRKIYAMRLLSYLPEKDIIEVSYKGFTTDPQNEIRRICDFIGVELDEQTLDINSERYFSLNTSHDLGGSGARFRRASPITYRDDQDTRWNLPQRALLSLLGKFVDGLTLSSWRRRFVLKATS